MSEFPSIIGVNDALIDNALVSKSSYQEMMQHALEDPDAFWLQQADRLDWQQKPSKSSDVSYDKDNVKISWFEDGKLNVSYNCLDRHLEKRADQVAMIFEADEQGQSYQITYQELYEQVCRCANVFKRMGVQKGDVVTIYMPMIPQTAVAMLACARIGAIHSVVFGGFSPKSLANRIDNCKSQFVVTANEAKRGAKSIPLKDNVDQALELANENIKTCFVYPHINASQETYLTNDFDIDLAHGMLQEETECQPVWLNAEDPLFILYTSGSTGAPKGVMHTSGGYLLYAGLTFEYIFDYRPGEVFWCTADFGWITGHSYCLYGPLVNGATTLIFEGVPNYPDFARFGQVIDEHKVNIFYTAPTAIRALMGASDQALNSKRESLRLMGSVGEPINPEAWRWYYESFGHSECPIVDTWWQTETGGVLMTPLIGVTSLKPGAAMMPFIGIEPALLDSEGAEIPFVEGEGSEGYLVLKRSWPGQMRTVYGDHQRFMDTYFSQYDGYYFTGDGAKRDQDGHYWITGRVDDVLNVSGHRLGTAEIESALVEHEAVAEAAVVGFPHELKGQGIYVYVNLMSGVEPKDELKAELKAKVRDKIGPIATIDHCQFAVGLPKTRSGKIMRRILRKIAENEIESIGDTSTLADATVVEDLIRNRRTFV